MGAGRSPCGYRKEQVDEEWKPHEHLGPHSSISSIGALGEEQDQCVPPQWQEEQGQGVLPWGQRSKVRVFSHGNREARSGCSSMVTEGIVWLSGYQAMIPGLLAQKLSFLL